MKRVLFFMLAFALCGFAAAADRPNILFCLADDWGWPHASAYGDPVVKTPAFDRLANEGVLFHQAYISCPSCTGSRNAILTGQQFYRLGQGASLHSSLDPRHPNFMFLLRDAGYQIGRWRKAWGPGDPLALGYEENPCGSATKFDTFLKQRDKQKPFCFWFGTTDPHRKYKTGSGAESGMDLAKINVPSFFPDEKTVRSDIADYYWEVQRWDRDVASALDLLEEAGELDNTIVVMTGDHGMPFPRCKGNLYDSGARVPLAIRWGVHQPESNHCPQFVSLTDLAPTFLQAAGVEVPEAMTGQSLLPVMTGRDGDAKRDFVVFGRERHTPAQTMPSMDGYPSRAIRTERWLLIENLKPNRWPVGVPENATHPFDSFADCDDGPTRAFILAHQTETQVAKHFALCFAKRPAVELYDCVADPDQVNNLAADPQHADTVERLQKQLVAYLQSTDDPRFTDAPGNFDEYPYRAKYMKQRLEEHGHTLPWDESP